MIESLDFPHQQETLIGIASLIRKGEKVRLGCILSSTGKDDIVSGLRKYSCHFDFVEPTEIKIISRKFTEREMLLKTLNYWIMHKHEVHYIVLACGGNPNWDNKKEKSDIFDLLEDGEVDDRIRKLAKCFIFCVGHAAHTFEFEPILALTARVPYKIGEFLGDAAKSVEKECATQEMKDQGIPFAPEIFLSSVMKKDHLKVNLLLSAGMLPDQRGHQGMTALMFAVELGDHSLVELLIDAGANVNAIDTESRSVLMHAVECADVDEDEKLKVIQTLIKASADYRKEDSRGRNVLHYCVERNCQKIVRYVVGLPGITCRADRSGMFPLTHACETKSIDSVRSLLTLPHSQEGLVQGLTAAVAMDSVDAVDAIFLSCWGLDAQQLDVIFQAQSPYMLRTLGRHGVRLDTINSKGQTRLCSIAATGLQDNHSLDLAKTLIELHTNVNWQDREGITTQEYSLHRWPELFQMIHENPSSWVRVSQEIKTYALRKLESWIVEARSLRGRSPAVAAIVMPVLSLSNPEIHFSTQEGIRKLEQYSGVRFKRETNGDYVGQKGDSIHSEVIVKRNAEMRVLCDAESHKKNPQELSSAFPKGNVNILSDDYLASLRWTLLQYLSYARVERLFPVLLCGALFPALNTMFQDQFNIAGLVQDRFVREDIVPDLCMVIEHPFVNVDEAIADFSHAIKATFRWPPSSKLNSATNVIVPFCCEGRPYMFSIGIGEPLDDPPSKGYFRYTRTAAVDYASRIYGLDDRNDERTREVGRARAWVYPFERIIEIETCWFHGDINPTVWKIHENLLLMKNPAVDQFILDINYDRKLRDGKLEELQEELESIGYCDGMGRADYRCKSAALVKSKGYGYV